MRHTFGGDLTAYTIGVSLETQATADGQTGSPAVILGGQTVTFWDAEYGGNQYTDLLDATTGGPDDPGGQPITSVVTSTGTDPAAPPLGCIPMLLGPNGVAVMWAQVGTGATYTPGPNASAYGMGEYGDGVYIGTDAAGTGVAGEDDGEMVGDDELPDEDEVIGDDTDPDVPVDDSEPVDDPGDTEPVDDEDGELPDDEETGDVGDDDLDIVGEVDATATPTVNKRLMIVASTAGWLLRDELDARTASLSPRLDSLEARAGATDTHLSVHDQQIAALSGNTGGGGGGGIGSGPSAQRPNPAAGTMYYDTDRNQLWVTITSVAAGTQVWAPIPGSCVFTARQTVQQQLNDGVSYPIAFDTVDSDLLGSAVTGQPTRFQPTVPGVYALTACVSFSGNAGAAAGSVRYLQWRLNGSTVAAATSATLGSESYTVTAHARPVSLFFNGSSDYADLVGYHNAGVQISTATTAWGQSTITATYQGGNGD